MYFLSLTVVFLGLARQGACGPFTSLVNLEKLYTIEDELITIADVILRGERLHHQGVDVHHIDKIESKLENFKEIHRQVGGENTTEQNIIQYVVHPINVFHLTKRLVTEWSSIATTLRDTNTCIKPIRWKVDNMRDNIPSEEQLINVGKSIINLQHVFDISIDDIIEGNILGNTSLETLSLEDQYTLARAAYEADDFNLTVDWLFQVIDSFDGAKDVDFSMASALNLLSSTYAKLKQPDNAMALIENILEIDPENTVALRNKKFMSEKVDIYPEDAPKVRAEKRKRKLTQELCSGKISKTVSLQSKLKCVYLQERNQTIFSTQRVMVEIMNYKPFIAVFHNLTDKHMQNATLHVGQEMMREFMYEDRYRNPYGMERVKIHAHKFDKKKLIPSLQDKLHNIQLTKLQPSQSNLVVRNIGMEGYLSTETIHPVVEKFYIGSFIVFLSEVEHGGEVVFPFSKTKVVPQKGSVLFYEKKAHSQWSICPVVLDTEWIAEYPLYDPVKRNICHKEALIRPRLS